MAYEFSGPGDVDRATGDNTSERSRAANEVAAFVETHQQFQVRDGFDGRSDEIGPVNHGFGLDAEPLTS